jgi:hypothetical protein
MRQAIIIAAHHPVALAAIGFNADAIDNRDATPPVGDEASM